LCARRQFLCREHLDDAGVLELLGRNPGAGTRIAIDQHLGMLRHAQGKRARDGGSAADDVDRPAQRRTRLGRQLISQLLAGKILPVAGIQ